MDQRTAKHTTQDIRDLGKKAQEQRQDLTVVLQTENNNGINTKIIMHYFPTVEEVAKLLSTMNGRLEGNSYVVRTGSKVQQFDVLDSAKLRVIKQELENPPLLSRASMRQPATGVSGVRTYEIKTPKSSYDVDVMYSRGAASPRGRTQTMSPRSMARSQMIPLDEEQIDIDSLIYNEDLVSPRSLGRANPISGMRSSMSPFAGLDY